MNNLDFSQYSDVHWRAQDSHENSLLFIKAGAEKYLSSAKYKLCVVDSDLSLQRENIVRVTPEEWIRLREQALNHFYPVHADLKLLGVTGTNGKTTVSDLVRQVCCLNHIEVKTIGTLGVYHNEKKAADFSLTTPDYIDLRKVLHNFNGVACLEMSSHALEQNRFGSLKFDAIAWTSFTQDHLDYHGSMEVYFSAKMKAFEYLKKDSVLLVPRDQKKLAEKIDHSKKKIVESVSLEGAFFKAQYNRENLGLALGILKEAGFEIKNIAPLNPPPGRFNIFEKNNFKAVVDFAHTPDGLESIGASIKNSFEDYKLITLFGCGGDRDRTKRPLMGKAASRYSDFLFITSDNPRFEEPEKIIDDIIPGVEIPYERNADRAEAIKLAYEKYKDEKAVLLIAGKGHEDYIDRNGKKTPYSDTETIKELMHD